MKNAVYYTLILGLFLANIQCSDNSDYGYVRDANNNGSKPPRDTPANTLPYFWWPNGMLIVQSVDSFAGSGEYESVINSFLGNLPIMIRDSTGSHPADLDYARADTISVYIDTRSDYIAVTPERSGLFGNYLLDYWEYSTIWDLTYHHIGNIFKFSGVSSGDILTSCPDSFENTSEYCFFEFEGTESDSVNTFVGTYKWAQVSSGSRCDISCTGKMTLIQYIE